LKYGKIATANPWRAYGLEWTVASPPPTENFAVVPIVTHEAYDYGWMDATHADAEPVVAGD
jgi:cytochrome c oxidase subunit 1